ncbi:hypothetical protein [Devosia rhizoryzae]|uniref:DUF2946 domain-containing protein n=1 Tax=Devosia rhizoryzae TaxID=2774137 RepID=A0ABX7CDQ2_9HYPH|nr:hypothetical protein [Devosia rhizoryzae]QQR40076.1 hypothetical protein JI748_03415 [Devosia rhizoryzae]
MKLLCSIVNTTALIIVLLMGAISVHADEGARSGHTHFEVADMSSHGASEDDHPGSGETAIHCGAPILAAEPVSVHCALRADNVVYFGDDPVTELSLSVDASRPPRT